MKIAVKIEFDNDDQYIKFTEFFTKEFKTKNDEVTGKQLKFMQKNNIPIPEGVTKTQASDMIQKFIDDHKEKKE